MTNYFDSLISGYPSLWLLIWWCMTGLAALILHLRTMTWTPKNHHPPKAQYNVPLETLTGSRRFKRGKVPDDVDHIVIGSGISGLTCAAALAKNGKRVLVLEKHSIPGGSIHVFEDHGVEFDTGFHYTGDVEKYQPLLDYLGCHLAWRKLGTQEDGYVYDRFHIRDRIYSARAGKQALINDLVRDFPDESTNINNYVNDVQSYARQDLFFSSKLFPSWTQRIVHYFQSSFYSKSRLSVYDYVSRFTENEDLKEVLCALSIDGGPPPSVQSSFMHASIVNHFMEGAYYPVGGAAQIPEKLISTIQSSGGCVLTKANATRILLSENGQSVEGVVVNDRHEISCSSIISSVGIPNTFQSDWIPLDHPIHSEFAPLLEKVPASVTYFFTYVVLNGTTDQLGLSSSNDWIWNSGRFEESIRAFEKDPFHTQPVTFIASSSAKDPTWETRYPGKSVVVVIHWSRREWFDLVDDGSSGKRTNSNYKDLKNTFEAMNIQTLTDTYPKTKDQILHYFSATPSTCQHYLGSYAVYGLDATTNRFQHYSCLTPKTSIRGLWLTGQDITTLGFAGSCMAGILTANAIEGYGSWDDILLGCIGVKRDLMTDLTRTD